MVRALLLGVLLIFAGAAIFAQVPVAPIRPLEKANDIEVAALPTPAPVSPLPSQEKAPELSIAIEASRAHPTAGGSFSLSAVVKNLRTKPITLTGRGSTLFLPPEVAGSETPRLCTYYGYFTTEAGKKGFSYDTPMTIAGGDSYAIEWTLGTPSGGLLQQMQPEGVIQSIVRKVKSEMEFVFFSAGDYEATVTLSYHAGDSPDFFQTITQSAVVHVAALQSVIFARRGGWRITRLYHQFALFFQETGCCDT